MTDLEDMNRARAEQENRAIKAENEVADLKKRLADANSSVEWQTKRAFGWSQRADANKVALVRAHTTLQKVKRYMDAVVNVSASEMERDRAEVDTVIAEATEYRDYIRQLEAVYIAVAKHCANCPMESDEALGKALNDVVMPADRR